MKLLVPGKWGPLPLLVAGCVLLAAGPSAGTALGADRAATPTVRLVFVGDIMLADIAAARSRHKADLVIPFLHWGRETRTEPSRHQRSLARKMIDAGADVVVGGHPHVAQGAEYYKGRLIVYSLGNFVFDGFDTEETLTGWILRLTMSKQGLVEWDTLASRIDEQGLPHPAPQVATPFGKAGTKEIGLRTAKSD